MATTMSLSKPVVQRQSGFAGRSLPALTVRTQPRRTQRQVTRAINDTNLIISGCTAGALVLGRFVFLPFQRDNLKRQGIGKPLYNNSLGPQQKWYSSQMILLGNNTIRGQLLLCQGMAVWA